MKNKYLIAFILIGVNLVLCGQEYAIDKGASFIAGMGSFVSEGGDLFKESGSGRTTTVTFSPSYNYYVTSNVFLGGGLEWSNTSGGESANSIGIGPQIGFAIGNSKSTVYPYFAVGVRYYNVTIGNSNSWGTGVNFGVGILIPLKLI